MREYLTVAGAAEAELTVKKSRFIGWLYPSGAEADIAAGLAAARAKWPRATHYCHGAILREPVLLERFSDDGEPSGTAGRPMLEVLRGAGLADVTAVVTRYFGGVLLGTGGLVRAYTETVQAALQQADIQRMVPGLKLVVHMEYGAYNQFMNKLFPLAIGAVESQFTDKVVLRLQIPQAIAVDFEQKLREFCQAEPETVETLYVPMKI
jgi:uncharacterized YigZ family protein